MIHHQHPQALVETREIGAGTRIWAYAHVLPGARIGADCNICDHVFIENDVVVGDRVTVKCGVQLWDGVRLEDDVFVGPNVTFSNDKYVRSRIRPEAFEVTTVRHGASIGANATILPGIEIGRYAMIGAGSVVTRNVPDYANVVGNPARISGYVDKSGHPVQVSRDTAADVVRTPPGGVGRLVKTPVGIGSAFVCTWPVHHDLRGSLVAAEVQESVPFEVKRFFFVFDVPGKHVRGAHSHRTCEQFLICTAGKLSVLLDDGNSQREVELHHPGTGLYLPPMVWAVQYKHSPGAVMLVFASELYDPNEYIREYDEFLRLASRTL